MHAMRLLVAFLVVAVATGCSGTRTFHDVARAGDTVTVAAGLKRSFSLTNIKVRITPDGGSPVDYMSGDPAIRAVTNLYLDPLSSMIISREINGDETPFARTYADTVAFNFTGDDKDWWQTIVVIDLPSSLPDGAVTVDISTLDDTETTSATLDIIPGTGSRNPLSAESLGSLQEDQLASLQRVEHYTVNFSGATVPYAIQLDLSHDADRKNGGTGLAYVVNPIGYIKNATWSDDGFNTRVILTPTKSDQIKTMSDFKFYLAGRVTNLSVSGVQAFDINGVPVSGVVASISP